eukprot:363361-Chlamydomonas_euryale.AAC.16
MAPHVNVCQPASNPAGQPRPNVLNNISAVCSNMRACYMTKPQAEAFYEVHRGKPFFEKLTTFMSSGRMVAIELVAEGAIARWRQLIGPTNSDKAREEAPGSIRARFGTDGSYNAVHGSDAPNTAAAELDFFFGRGSRVGVPVIGRDTTLCVIKPHVVSEGLAGYMLDLIGERGMAACLTRLVSGAWLHA